VVINQIEILVTQVFSIFEVNIFDRILFFIFAVKNVKAQYLPVLKNRVKYKKIYVGKIKMSEKKFKKSKNADFFEFFFLFLYGLLFHKRTDPKRLNVAKWSFDP
jgi:hypothetical protein